MSVTSKCHFYLLISNEMCGSGSRLSCLLRGNNMAAAAMITLRDMHIATATEADCRRWLRGQRLLAANMQCQRCYTVMEEKDYGRVLDGRIWRCPPKQCRATVSLRKGSFFERSNLPLTKLTDMIYYWAMEISNAEAECQVMDVSVVFVFSIQFTSMRFTRLLHYFEFLNNYRRMFRAAQCRRQDRHRLV